MEELKSTETLDREIEADAQRKAASILKQAEAQANATREEWRRKLEEELRKERGRFESELAAYKAQVDARLTLDRRRLECEAAVRSLDEAAQSFLGTVERRSLIALLERSFLLRVAEAFEGDFSGLKAEPPVLSSRCLSDAELAAILDRAFPALDRSRWKTGTLAAGACGEADLAIELDCKSVKISVSFGAELHRLLLDRRAELVAALGGEACA